MALSTSELVQQEALRIAVQYTAEGWIEYLLWEVLEGVRERPFKFLPPLEEEDRLTLVCLREDLGQWFFWKDGQWYFLPVDQWAVHAKSVSSDDAIRSISSSKKAVRA